MEAPRRPIDAKPPLWVQEHDTPDAWSFVVLGEKYESATSFPELVFLGWHAQQVTYENDLSHFLGTDQIGSEYAEREALFWAGVWRLSININVPTVFLSDSVTTTEQALGLAGCSDQHPTFHHLRGVFQALQATMPAECLDVRHVRGHTGDPWNELADYLAKSEAAKGHQLKRQAVDLREFLPMLPYIWMVFDGAAGLPAFTGEGFDIGPPTLPPTQPDQVGESQQKHERQSCRISISLATLNVGSLFTGPEGYEGKLTYIREQMQSLHLNFLGLQEARSPAGMTQVDQVIRLSSGAHKGQHGVELWINTNQPIGKHNGRDEKLQARHVQVTHSDPRRLVVRLAHSSLDGLFVVLHAPQSGRPLQERQAWWNETQTIIHHYQGQLPLYVLMDANAKTGPCQMPFIHAQDDTCSVNTEFLRDFLKVNELCLPCTTDIHEGTQATWTAIDGQTTHRIDYVAIPHTELQHCTMSRVLQELDPGNGTEDHCAAAVQLTWQGSVEPPGTFVSRVPQHNRTAIQHCQKQIDLTTVNVGTWKENIEAHVQGFNQQVMQILQTECPVKKQGPKKPFLSKEVWELRSAKLHLRKRLHSTQAAKP